MIAHLFIALALAVAASAPLNANELPIKISLGIRETKFPAITNVAFPLAFKIQNAGRVAIKQDQLPALFFKGVVHVLSNDGRAEETQVQRHWRTMVHDLQSGETFESPVVANLLSFFPSLKDGVYQVWWTLGDFKSNILSFTVVDGKVSKNDSKG